MQKCCRLSQNRNANIISVFGMLSLLLLILFLPQTVRSQHIIDLAPLEIRIKEHSDSTISLEPKEEQKFKATAAISAGGPEIDYIEFFAEGAKGKQKRKKNMPWYQVNKYWLTYEVEYEWSKVGGPFTVNVKAVATNGKIATSDWRVTIDPPAEELEIIDYIPPADIIITKAQAQMGIVSEGQRFTYLWEIDDEVRIGVGDQVKFVLEAECEDDIEFIEFSNGDPNPSIIEAFLNKDTCIIGCKKHSHSRGYKFDNLGDYIVTGTVKTEKDIEQVSWKVTVLPEPEPAPDSVEEVNLTDPIQPPTNQNQKPIPIDTINSHTLTVGNSSSPLDVSNYFNDPDGDILTYEVRSHDAAVATTQELGSQVIIWGWKSGTTTITVIAIDPGGLYASLDFTVTVTDYAPQPARAIDPISLTLEGGATTVDVGQNFNATNPLTFSADSIPSGIVTTSVSGTIITITPVSPGPATVEVTARDTVTGLTAIQTILVLVRQSQATIVRPANNDPTWTPTTINNPRAEGLREGVSVIVDGLAAGNILNVRSDAGTNYADIGDVTNGDYGIITDGPRSANGFTWWEIDWDTQRFDGWSTEVVDGVQLLFRHPPDLEIIRLDVSDSEVSLGEDIEIEIEIHNNGPGESAQTDVYIYYSETQHSNLEDLADDDDLRGGWRLSVPSISERSTETLTYRVDAPTVIGSYYYGALLPSNIHASDNTDHIDEEAIRNNLAREELVRVIGSPDYIVESISLSGNRITFDPGDSFTLRATVRNIGLGEPSSSATLDYYRSSDARISTEVTVSIHSVDGTLIRRLDLGHQEVGIYQHRSNAAHWDGKNAQSEPVASGVYFYTLAAGNFTATRKMLIQTINSSLHKENNNESDIYQSSSELNVYERLSVYSS